MTFLHRSFSPALRSLVFSFAAGLALTVGGGLQAQSIVAWRSTVRTNTASDFAIPLSFNSTTSAQWSFLVTSHGFFPLNAQTGMFGSGNPTFFPAAVKADETSYPVLRLSPSGALLLDVYGIVNRLYRLNATTLTVLPQQPFVDINVAQAANVMANGTPVLVADDTVYIVNPATGAVSPLFQTGSLPIGLAMGHGDTMSILTKGDSTVRTYAPGEGGAYSLVSSFTFGANAAAFAASAWGTYYVYNGDGVTTAYNAQGQILQTFSTGSVVDPNGGLGISQITVTRDGTITLLEPQTQKWRVTQFFDAAALSGSVRRIRQDATFAAATDPNPGLYASSDFSGPDGLAALVAETLTLTGNNTYSGITGLRSGTLIFGTAGSLSPNTSLEFVSGILQISPSFIPASGALRTTTAPWQLVRVDTNGSNIDLALNATLGSTLEKLGAGKLTITNDATYTETTTISAGTLQIGAGGTSGALGATAIANAGALIFDRADASTFAGSISGAGSVTKNGAGTLSLTGNNTLTGVTTIAAGTLQFAKTGALYGGNTGSWTAANLTVEAGATLGFSVGGSGEFTLAQWQAFQTLGSATTGLKNGAFLGLDTTNLAASYTYTPVLADSGGRPFGFAKLGAGTLTLSGANAYTGGTLLDAGTLTAGSDTAFGTGTIRVNGGTLDLASHSVANLLDVRDGQLGGLDHYTGTQTVTGTATYSGTVGGDVTVGNSGNVVTTGARFGAITVQSGGRITGTGTVGSLTLQAGSFLAPGSSPGLLTVSGDLSLGGTTLMELAGGTRGTSYDAINVGGALTFGGALTVSLLNGYTPANGSSFALFNYTTATSSGHFSAINLPGLDPGLHWDSGSLYTTGVISVSAIPEPSTYALLAGTVALGLAGWRRRNRRR